MSEVSEFAKEKIGALGSVIVCLLLIAAFGGMVFYGACVEFVDNYKLPFCYNTFDGTIKVLDRTGYIIKMPFRDQIHGIDLRPYQVAINANSRILNAKLVQFDRRGLDTFVAWHGRDAGDDLNQLKEILKGYAFDVSDGKDCPFLIVVNQVAPTQVPPPLK